MPLALLKTSILSLLLFCLFWTNIRAQVSSGHPCTHLSLSNELLDKALSYLRKTKSLAISEESQKIQITMHVIATLALDEQRSEKALRELRSFEEKMKIIPLTENLTLASESSEKYKSLPQYKALLKNLEKAKESQKLLKSLQEKSQRPFYKNTRGLKQFQYSESVFLELIKNKDEYMKRTDCQTNEKKNPFPIIQDIILQVANVLAPQESACFETKKAYGLDTDFLCKEFEKKRREDACTENVTNLSFESYIESDLNCYRKLMNVKVLIFDKEALEKKLQEIRSFVPSSYLVDALKIDHGEVSPKNENEHPCVKTPSMHKAHTYHKLQNLSLILVASELQNRAKELLETIRRDVEEEKDKTAIALIKSYREDASFIYPAMELSDPDIFMKAKESFEKLEDDYYTCNFYIAHTKERTSAPFWKSIDWSQELKRKAKTFFTTHGLDADIFDPNLEGSLSALLKTRDATDLFPGHEIDVTREWVRVKDEELGKVLNYCFSVSDTASNLKDSQNYLKNLFAHNSAIRHLGPQKSATLYLLKSAAIYLKEYLKGPQKDTFALCLDKWRQRTDIKNVFMLGKLDNEEYESDKEELLEKIKDLGRAILFESFKQEIISNHLDREDPSREEVILDESFIEKLTMPESKDIGNIITRYMPRFFDQGDWNKKTLEEKTKEVFEKLKREKKITRAEASILLLAGVITNADDFDLIKGKVNLSANQSLKERNQNHKLRKEEFAHELLTLGNIERDSLIKLEKELEEDLLEIKEKTSNENHLQALPSKASVRLSQIPSKALESTHSLSQYLYEGLWYQGMSSVANMNPEYYLENRKEFADPKKEAEASRDAYRILQNEYFTGTSIFGSDEEFYNISEITRIYKSLPIVYFGQGISNILEIPRDSYIDFIAESYGQTREEFLTAANTPGSHEAYALLVYDGAQLIAGLALTGLTGRALKGATILNSSSKVITPTMAITAALKVNAAMSFSATLGQELTQNDKMDLGRGLQNYVRSMSASALFSGGLGVISKFGIYSQAFAPKNAALFSLATDILDGSGDIEEVLNQVEEVKRNWIPDAQGNLSKTFGLILQGGTALFDLGGETIASGLYYRLTQMRGENENGLQQNSSLSDIANNSQNHSSNETSNPEEKAHTLFLTFERNLKNENLNSTEKQSYFFLLEKQNYILSDLLEIAKERPQLFSKEKLATINREYDRYLKLIDEINTEEKRKLRLKEKGISIDEVIQNSQRSLKSMQSNKEAVEKILGLKISNETWQKLIPPLLEAYHSGSATLFNYSQRELNKKRSILLKVGLTSEEISKLMDYGIIAKQGR